MRFGLIAVSVLVLATSWASPISLAETMDFQSAAIGTKYGNDFGNFPGQLVLTENGIEMSVERFFLNQFTGFYQAQVKGPVNDHELAIDNINVLFNLTDLPFNVTSLTIQYTELGGNDNFAVNGSSILQLAQFTDIPTNIAAGVTAVVDGGLIALTGDINTVLIGGQELTVDTIVAVPEPTSLLLLGAGGMLVWRRFRKIDRVPPFPRR